MKIKLVLALMVWQCLPMQSTAKSDTHKLFINRGNLVAVDTSVLPNLAFNTSPSFKAQNEIITVAVNDSLSIWVFNNDTLPHLIKINGQTGSTGFINPGDSALLQQYFSEPGLHILYDAGANFLNYYMGLAAMIHVTSPSANKSFYWNIREQQRAVNASIIAGQNVDWNTYDPEYFLLNGRSNPFINYDTTARPTGKVGDTILICVANTGQSIHSLHFHGYHTEILYSSKFPTHVGRSKDTHPIYSLSTLILQLVPDKPGEFPVHDHNLVAVTGGGLYPNGMFLTLLIAP